MAVQKMFHCHDCWYWHDAPCWCANAAFCLSRSWCFSMINQGSSEVSIMFGIDAHDAVKAVRALYDAFFYTGC